MTAPAPPPTGRTDWWARPRVVLPVVAVLVLIVALLSPQDAAGRAGDPRLTTHFAGPLNARLLYETASRLGWHVRRRDSLPTPERGPRGETIHAILDPALRVAPREAHAYLEAVRAGDGLLLVIDQGRTPLADSLGLRIATGDRVATIASDTLGCPRRFELVPPLWPDDQMRLYGLAWTRPAPAERRSFGLQRTSRGEGTPRDYAVGFPLGRGHVVVVSDPDLLRNDVLRRCRYGADVRAVRMLEWLRDAGTAPRTTLVFDEYHQGFGPHPSMLGAVGDFLAGHPVGRMLLQAALAGLVLLLAVAPRPIAPLEVDRVQRRDPLEQIDALAHAYEQVHATRTVAARLLHGVRARAERGWSPTRSLPNDDFLTDLAHREPGLAGDAALVRRALRESIPERELTELGAALARIERALTPTTLA
jgi:hypothetical protein